MKRTGTFLMGLLWAVPGAAQETNDDAVRHLTELKHMLGPAYVERKPEVLERVYAEDYVVIDANGNRRTKADDLAMLAANDRQYTFSKYDVTEVRVGELPVIRPLSNICDPSVQTSKVTAPLVPVSSSTPMSEINRS